MVKSNCEGDVNVLCDINVAHVLKESGIDINNILQLNETLNKFNKQDISSVWKYICANFHFLDLLKESLDNTSPDDVLSVQQIKLLKNIVKNIAGLGIRCNLQSNIPTYKTLAVQYTDDEDPILIAYNRLAATTYTLITYFKCTKLRNVILDNFKPILSSLYQIIYCPLKKANSSESKLGNFIMTNELYNRLMTEKIIFRKELDYLEKYVLKAFYVRETMLLPENNSPLWLIKAIAQNLNAVICSPQGIETIAWAMFDSSVDYDPNDKAKNWRILDIIMKLILNFRDKPEFSFICEQLKQVIDVKDNNGKFLTPFVDLCALCVKRLHALDKSLCVKMLLPAIFNYIEYFRDKDLKFNNEEGVTKELVRDIHMLYICFIDDNNIENLPIDLLMPSINIIFYLCSVISHSSLKAVQNELQEILIKFLGHTDTNQYFDLFLFDIEIDGVDMLRNDIFLEVNNEDFTLKLCDFKTTIDINTKSEVLMEICKSNRKLYINFFLYLLNVLVEYEKYLNAPTKSDLLDVETEFVLNKTVQIKLIVYQLLSELSEDVLVQNYIKENPIDIIKYLENSLQRMLNCSVHKISDCDSEKFQSNFTLIMILQALVMNSTNYDPYKQLLPILKSLFRESIHLEFRDLLQSIIKKLENHEIKTNLKNETKSEIETALDDICDPLLPVRGHGLMILTKLIECKNPEAMERKHYILNIFQQNLKNDDSFIYLSAINGLAAMGCVFPDIIINTLTDEYSDIGRKSTEDRTELRMKLGEILLRVTKTLGDTAPKYKSILLNTFLLGAKDEDPLIRASSLSNLGEVCRVLGYKLGTIVSEILVCVHSIITTDKAVEARRAALTVIRQLLTGLEVEMITFLKDHILDIYRTLKMIYHGDKDDVMKLHAQLALEELNENVNKFLVQSTELQFEKTNVLLNQLK